MSARAVGAGTGQSDPAGAAQQSDPPLFIYKNSGRGSEHAHFS